METLVITDWKAGTVQVTGRLLWGHAWFVGRIDRYNEYTRSSTQVKLGNTAVVCLRGVTWGLGGRAHNPTEKYRVPVTAELLEFLEKRGCHDDGDGSITVEELADLGLASRERRVRYGLRAK